MLRLQRDGMELKLLGRGAVLLGFLSVVPLGLSGAGHKEGGAAFLPWEGLRAASWLQPEVPRVWGQCGRDLFLLILARL